MVKAYVILAHTNPLQLFRLVQALNDGSSFFFVHIDRSSDISEFEALNQFSDRLQFLRREKASWASYGLVQAMLHGLKAVKASNHTFRHVILLSGQDYPIKSNAFIDRFTKEHQDKIFLQHHRLPDPEKWQPNGGLYRVNKYFIGFKWWQRLCSRALNLLSTPFGILRRTPYQGMDPYAGSMWWILNMTAIEYILDFIQRNPRYIDYHQYTFAADEVFFHMILLNAKDEKVAGSIVNEDKRFIKWKDMSSAHPEVIDKKALPELINSDALFARKFDSQRDNDILDLLDQHRCAN